jgi:hypothetical protein
MGLDWLKDYATSTPENEWQNLNPFSEHFVFWKMPFIWSYGFREAKEGAKETFDEALRDTWDNKEYLQHVSIRAVRPWSEWSLKQSEKAVNKTIGPVKKLVDKVIKEQEKREKQSPVPSPPSPFPKSPASEHKEDK